MSQPTSTHSYGWAWDTQAHDNHLHIDMNYAQETTREEIKAPPWTYETLEEELYHKGHGKRMEKRKVGNNTWLMRDGDRIVVRLHNTDILTYYPDNRVVLNASHWYTVTTKDRMNAFLGYYTVFSERGDWRVSVRFRRGADRYGDARYIEGMIPFENYMALDVHTHEVISHPNDRFLRVDDSVVLREANDLSRILASQSRVIREKINDESITNDDLRHALKVLQKYQESHKSLKSQIERLERSMDWASTELEDQIMTAIRRHADIQFERRGKLQKLFDPEEVETILDDLV